MAMSATRLTLVLASLLLCGATGLAVVQHRRRCDAEHARVAWNAKAEKARADLARAEQDLKRLRSKRPSADLPIAAPAKTAPIVASVPAEPKAAIRAAVHEAERMAHVARLVAAERYLHPRFEQLGLSQEQWTKHEMFLLDMLESDLDARRSALKGPALQEALAAAKALYEQKTRDLVGAEAFAALQELEERNAFSETPGAVLVSELAGALRFTSEPLDAEQRRTLAKLVETQAKPSRAVYPPMLSDELLAEAEKFLSPAQAAMLRRTQSIYGPLHEMDDLVMRQAEAASAAQGKPAPK